MKAIGSISVMVAALAMLALSVPVPAFSAMKDMSMQQHRGGYGQHSQRVEMCNMDKMDDMMAMCREHADKLGLTDEQTMKMKPIHSEMQKKQARFTADLKRRLNEHKTGNVDSTKNRQPLELIHYEAYLNEKDAKRREKY